MKSMTVEEGLRGLAGGIVLGSLALGFWVHPGFLLLTAFVGANLLQSAFTGTCPAMAVLRWLGLPEAVSGKASARQRQRGSPAG